MEKNLKNIIIMCMIAIAAFIIYMLTGCKNRHTAEKPLNDSISQIVEEYTNPQFDNVEGFVNYAKTEVQYNEFITTVSKMHPNTIGSIVTSALQKHKTCDWKTFMNEYENDKILYNNVDAAAKKLYPERAGLPQLNSSDTIDLNKINVESINN